MRIFTSIALAATLALSTSARALSDYSFDGSWSYRWLESLGFADIKKSMMPYGVSVSGSGDIYVLDSSNSNVHRFSADATHLKMWGEIELMQPLGIAVGSEGSVYVADTLNDRVVKYTPILISSSFGSSGAGVGQLSYPSDLAVDDSGNIFVADTGNNRIQKFVPAGEDYSAVGIWGSEGQLKVPSGIAVDDDSNVYVADSGNDRIQKFNSEGGLMLKWGASGSGDGQFNNPIGIAVDQSGDLFIADSGNDRIQKFSPEGGYLAKLGSSGSDDGKFNHPTDIAIDGDGNLFVTDFLNYRVQKFKSISLKLVPPDPPPPNPVCTQEVNTVTLSLKRMQRISRILRKGLKLTGSASVATKAGLILKVASKVTARKLGLKGTLSKRAIKLSSRPRSYKLKLNRKARVKLKSTMRQNTHRRLTLSLALLLPDQGSKKAAGKLKFKAKNKGGFHSSIKILTALGENVLNCDAGQQALTDVAQPAAS